MEEETPLLLTNCSSQTRQLRNNNAHLTEEERDHFAETSPSLLLRRTSFQHQMSQSQSQHSSDSGGGISLGHVLQHHPEEILEDELEPWNGKRSHDRHHHANHHHRRPIVSLEFLNPTHECKSRVSSPLVATFNLVATVCGGGVLSLPLCFARAGIFPTTFLMLFCSITTDFCLYILCSCARRTGGRSYGDVTKAAFGSIAEIMSNALLSLSLCGSLIAYMVLAKGIWTPILVAFLSATPFDNGDDDDSLQTNRESLEEKKDISPMILAGILITATPLLLKRDLHALRYTCYVGFTSLVLLTIGIVYRAYERNVLLVQTSDEGDNLNTKTQTQQQQSIKWWTSDMSDILGVFPIIATCFFCTYNVLSVHASLFNPTRERVKFVLDSTVGTCMLIFYIVGVGGYLCFYDDTSDNILTNFPLDDKIILLGRMGYGFTIMFAMPLLTLPCRESCLALPEQIRMWRLDSQEVQSYVQLEETRQKYGAHLVVNGVDFDEERPLLISDDPVVQHGTFLLKQQIKKPDQEEEEHPGNADPTTTTILEPVTPSNEYKERKRFPPCDNDHNLPNSSSSYQSQSYEEQTAETSIIQSLGEDHHDSDLLAFTTQGTNDDDYDSVWKEEFIHTLSTFIIIGLCYIAAVLVPGVALVWGICGSSMTLTIGFVIPTACYLKIREKKKINPRSIASWLLLIFFSIATVICTTQVLISSTTETGISSSTDEIADANDYPAIDIASTDIFQV